MAVNLETYASHWRMEARRQSRLVTLLRTLVTKEQFAAAVERTDAPQGFHDHRDWYDKELKRLVAENAFLRKDFQRVSDQLGKMTIAVPKPSPDLEARIHEQREQLRELNRVVVAQQATIQKMLPWYPGNG